MVQRVHINQIKDSSDFLELIGKLRSTYDKELHKCKLFGYLARPAYNDIMVELNAYRKREEGHNIPERDIDTLTLAELQPFISYMEVNDRNKKYSKGKVSIKELPSVIQENIFIPSMDDIPSGEDWSIRARGLTFLKDLTQTLEDGGITGFKHQRMMVERRDDFLQICAAIIRCLHSNTVLEKDATVLIRFSTERMMLRPSWRRRV